MAGRYCFWYCMYHDCGVLICKEPNEYDMKAELNIPCCGVNNPYCKYVCKGILEYDNNEKIEEIQSVQKNYDREAGNWEWKYYLDNMYNVSGKEIVCNEKINKMNHILEWYYSK